jgi:lipopolysaccharide biosynthesis regulator YciM
VASGDVAQARENIQRALAEGTRDGRLYYHAGAIAAAAGANAEALEFLNQARRLERMLLPSERQALEQNLTALIAGTSQLSVN